MALALVVLVEQICQTRHVRRKGGLAAARANTEVTRVP